MNAHILFRVAGLSHSRQNATQDVSVAFAVSVVVVGETSVADHHDSVGICFCPQSRSLRNCQPADTTQRIDLVAGHSSCLELKNNRSAAEVGEAAWVF